MTRRIASAGLGVMFPIALLAAVLVCAGQSRPAATAPASQPSRHYGDPHALFTIQSAVINEASGLLVSRTKAGIYYTHNDSGGQPEIYALDSKGGLRAVLILDGAQNVDWEDISFAPGATSGMYDIVAADIGDNQNHRTDIRVYRFAEPELPKAPGGQVHVQPLAYDLRYETGPANAEAFIVNPGTGDGFVITKRTSQPALVLKVAAPWKKDAENLCVRVAEIDLPIQPGIGKLITAADLSPDGKTLALRTYTFGWLLRAPSGAGPFEQIFAQPAERIDLAAEPQGEAICFSPDGRRLLTTSEGPHPPVYESCLDVPVGNGP